MTVKLTLRFEFRQNDFQQKEADNQLPFSKTMTSYQQNYKKVPWTFSPDGCIRDGDNLMIRNKKTEGWLVMDIDDKLKQVEEAYMVTTTKQHTGPVTRSVFVIKKAEKMDMFGSDNIIRYGQKVILEANPYIFRKPLYLSSTPHGPQTYSPVSRQQEVSMHSKSTYLNQWIIDYSDPNYRLEKQGEPVTSSSPFHLRHCQTLHYLSSDNVRYAQNYGGECEVSEVYPALLYKVTPKSLSQLPRLLFYIQDTEPCP